MFNQILSNLAIMFLLVPFALMLMNFFPISIFKVKNSVFLTQILVSLPVWNIFNQISSKFPIMFLLAHFILQLIYIFLISISKVKNCVFSPKTCISSRLEHVQPNFVKIGNNVLVGSLYTSAYTIISYFNFYGKKSVF